MTVGGKALRCWTPSLPHVNLSSIGVDCFITGCTTQQLDMRSLVFVLDSMKVVTKVMCCVELWSVGVHHIQIEVTFVWQRMRCSRMTSRCNDSQLIFEEKSLPWDLCLPLQRRSLACTFACFLDLSVNLVARSLGRSVARSLDRAVV